MSVTITPANPARPDFVGVVAGIDLRQPVSAADAAAIDAGMDHYGVLVFHGQDINDEQQLAFSRNFGPLETATGDIAKVADRRLAMEVNDISNLDKNSNVLARDDRRRLFSLGNMLWHSDSSFKATPAKYSLLSARVIPGEGGNTEFADMRAAWDALDPTLKTEIRDLIRCGAIRRPGGFRCFFQPMPGRFMAGPCQKPAPCCVTLRNTPRNANSSMLMSGARMIW